MSRAVVARGWRGFVGVDSIKWTSSGQVVPAHGHLLIVGSAYSGAAVGDDLPFDLEPLRVVVRKIIEVEHMRFLPTNPS